MASLATRPEDVLFRAGIRQDLAQQVATPGTLIDARNVRWRSAVGGVDGRPGNALVPSTTVSLFSNASISSLTAIGLIARLAGTDVLGANGNLYARVGTAFRECGSYGAALPVQKRYGLAASTRGADFEQVAPCCAVDPSGNLLVASVDDAGVMHAYIESSDGVRLWYHRQTTTVVRKVQALCVGSVLYLVYQVAATINLIQITVSAGSVSAGSITAVTTLSANNANWDSSAFSSTEWLLVYQSNAVSITILKLSGATPTASTAETVAGLPPVSIYGDSSANRVWVGWYNDPTVSGAVRARPYSGSLVASAAAQTLATAVNVYGPPLFGNADYLGGVAGGTVMYAYRYVSGTSPDYTRGMYTGLMDYGGGLSGNVPTWHVTPISKPFAGGRIWVMTTNGDGSTRTIVYPQALLLRYQNPALSTSSGVRPVTELSSPYMESLGTASPEFTYGTRTLGSYFHAVAEGESSSFFAFPFCIRTVLGLPQVNVEVYEFTTHDQEPFRSSVELGAQLGIAGQPYELFGQGAPSYGPLVAGVDATYPVSPEYGFPQFPVITEAAVTSPGGNIAAGTYQYRCVYLWADQYGRAHWSAPSEPVNVSVGAANSYVTLRVTTLDLSQRQGALPATLYMYRTLAGGTDFRLTKFTSSYDAADGIVTIIDDNNNADIQNEGSLYSDGALENDLAPCGRFICATETRVWIGGLWDGTLIQSSKLLRPDEPPVFSQDRAFQVVLNGKCTGLAAMDGTLIAFTRNSIQLVSGDGPDDRGVGEFAQPRTLSAEVGCIDHRSVLVTEIGVFFQAERGLYLLPRGFGAPRFIGDPVHLLTWQYPVCRGAAFYADGLYRLARFLMHNEDGDAHIELIYDLDAGGWMYDTHSTLCNAIGRWNAGRFLGFADLDASASCGYLEAPDASEGSNQDLDGTTGFDSVITTADIRPFGVGGFGKIPHGTLVSSDPTGIDTLTLSLYTDAVVTIKSWVPAAATGTDYRRVVPSGNANQGCTVVSATVTVTRPNTTGTRGPTLHGLVLEKENFGGARRLSGDQQ